MKRFFALVIVACVLSPLAAKPVREAPKGKLTFVDLQPKSNRTLARDLGSGGEDSHLKELPAGEQVLGGVKFKIGAGLIQLGSKIFDKLPAKVEGIKVDQSFALLHVLHATLMGGGPNEKGDPGFVADDTLIGEYRVNFVDRGALIIPIVYGKDVRDWWFIAGEPEPTHGKVVWKGDNERTKQFGVRLRLYLSTWENPWPNKKVTSIDYLSKMEETGAAPFCVAMTVEEAAAR
jgi:hypothetical protein